MKPSIQRYSDTLYRYIKLSGSETKVNPQYVYGNRIMNSTKVLGHWNSYRELHLQFLGFSTQFLRCISFLIQYCVLLSYCSEEGRTKHTFIMLTLIFNLENSDLVTDKFYLVLMTTKPSFTKPHRRLWSVVLKAPHSLFCFWCSAKSKEYKAIIG